MDDRKLKRTQAVERFVNAANEASMLDAARNSAIAKASRADDVLAAAKVALIEAYRPEGEPGFFRKYIRTMSGTVIVVCSNGVEVHPLDSD